MKKILLPVDEHDLPVKAFEMGKELALKYSAEIIIVNVKDPEVPFTLIEDEVIQKNKEIVNGKVKNPILEKAENFFKDSNLTVNTITAFGDPPAKILDIAEREKCDMIVMCTHGMSAPKRFLIGSVTNKVVHHATMPVLVVR